MELTLSSKLDEPPYVRRRLARKMRFLLSGDAPVPASAELRKIYDADPGRFGGPGVPFEQVEPKLREEWRFRWQRALIERRVAELRRSYRVVVAEDAK